jgi:dUTP pyrophosphatase
MKLKIKRLDPRAVIPTYGTDGAGCFDITAITRDHVAPGISLYRTGLAFEVPPGYIMEVFSRSGHGFNDHTRLANCVGVVDADYRGELMVKLVRDDHETEMPWPGDRVAQAKLTRVTMVDFIEVDELSNTARGVGGFGSTGN